MGRYLVPVPISMDAHGGGESLRGGWELSIGQVGAGGASLQSGVGHSWLRGGGLTACVCNGIPEQARGGRRPPGVCAAGLCALSRTNWDWPKELHDVLAPGTSVPAPGAPWLSISTEQRSSLHGHCSSHRSVRMEASYGLISLNTDATRVL